VRVRAKDVLLDLLRGCVTEGRIHFREGDEVALVGPESGASDGPTPAMTVRVFRPRFYSRVLAYGNLGLGEAYMDRDFAMETGELHDFLTLLLRSRIDQAFSASPRHALALAWIRLRSRLQSLSRNACRHYDLGDELFQAFLDPTLTYSCGYALREGDSLSELQTNKFDRILRKLEVRPGHRLLDVGCGYGGLLVYAAQHHGIRGVGITNSRQHAAGARAAVARAGLSQQIEVRLQDFKELTGAYDRVVSVGMLEHVPRRQYRHFFGMLGRVLAHEGKGLVHVIGCNGAHNRHDPFFQKYIFPGSNQPRLSEIAEHLERNALPILDVENMARHYARTTRAWLARFRASRHRLDPDGYDDVFQRMWEYYLCCGIAGSLASDAALYQVLFARSHTDPIPLHRV
jgi:cyclopropane-fatty-acyl-phospholipid synthase